MPIAPSKRCLINLNTPQGSEFQYIDHVRGATQFGGPSSGSPWLTTGGPVWGQNVDSDGWPAYSTVTINKRASFGGVYLPDSTICSDYTIDGFGSGTITFSAGTWAFVSGTGTSLAGTTLTMTDQGVGVRWSARLTYTGAALTIGLNANVIDPLNTGKFLKQVRFYRTAEASQLAAGKIFRAAWKQTYVDFNPSAIRFMNWLGDNDAKNCRFENRNLPSHGAWTGASNWVSSPKYGETAVANQMTLAAVTGTPASMQHGEIATCRIGVGMTRIGTPYPGKTITNITSANPGVVTCIGHGFNTGDVVIHEMGGCFPNLHRFPVTVTVIDADNYSIGVATSGSFAGPSALPGQTIGSTGIQNMTGGTAGINIGMLATGPGVPAGAVVTGFYATGGQPAVFINMNTTVASGTYSFTGTGTVNQFASLQVGSGSDRTPYPIMFPTALTYASWFGAGYIVAGDHKTFVFDKTLYQITDGSGNPVYGVWFFNDVGVNLGHKGGVPLEVCTALMNELNAMSPVNPIDMWVTMPHWGLMTGDPNYTAASNFAVKATDVIMNGAGGYAGLSGVNLWIEYSNETWNSGGSAFPQASYLARRGQCRTGSAWAVTTTGDYSSMVGLRSYLMCKDIQAAFPGNARIKFVMAGQGTLGIGVGNTNYLRLHGTTAMLTDTLNPSGDEPIKVHDAFAWAGYLYNNDSNSSYSLATATTQWVAAGSDPVAKEAAYATYVAGIKTYGGSQTIDRYFGTSPGTLLYDYAAHMQGLTPQKLTCMYEGGWDHAINGTTQNQQFLLACKASQTWADALVAGHNNFNGIAGAVLPADYIQTGVLSVGDRWGHGLNVVDGVGLDLAWQGLATRNRGAVNPTRQYSIRTA